MSDFISKNRRMISGHRWQLIEMSDRSLAMYKTLARKTGEPVSVVIRSNSIILYRYDSAQLSFLQNDIILSLGAQDVTLRYLADIFYTESAAEIMAVFTLNRRALFQVVHRKGKL